MNVQGNEGQVDTGAAPEGSTAVIIDGEGGTTNEPIQGQEDQGGEQQQAETQTQEEQQQRDDKGRYKSNLQDRIDALTRQRHEASREAEYWRRMAQGTQAQPSAPAAQPKPTPDQFDDYGTYVEALTDWKTDQAVQKRMSEESSRRVQETRASTFQERVAQFAQATPDFAEVMTAAANMPLAQHVIESMQDSDYGAQLGYHFAKNPEVLDRLNHMDPRAADREIGRIEASFVNKPAAPPPPATKATKAPAPPSNLGQGRASTPTLADASMDQYMEMRKKQGARWAR